MRIGQRRTQRALVWWILLIAVISFAYIPQVVIAQKVEDDNEEARIAAENGRELIVQPDYFLPETVYQQIDNFITQNGVGRMDNFQITNLVLTSDIEGNLNAVNRKTGELLWSLVGGQPLVSIKSDADIIHAQHTTPVAASSDSIDTTTRREYSRYSNAALFESSHTKSSGSDSRRYIQNKKKEDITWIVEPYGDGTVYHFMGDEGLEKLPISIKQFVLNSPFSIDDQFVYTGRRVSGIVKISARTGAIVESFGLDSVKTCSSLDINSKSTDGYGDRGANDDDDYYNNEQYSFEKETDYFGSHGHNSEDNEVGPFITLGKTIYDLTIHSKNNTSWNITYVQWGPNNLHANLIPQNTNSADDIYIQPFHDSSLLALDVDSKSIKWVSNLPYVTVNIFDVFANSVVQNDYVVLPHPIDYGSSSLPNDKEESTYLDRTKEGSWYALSEKHYPSLVRSAPVAKYITNERWRLPSIFQNDDLLDISISGVHDNSLRKNSKEDPERIINKHLAVYQSATAISVPEKYNGLTYSPERPRKVTKANMNDDIENDSFNEEGFKAPTLTFKSSSISQLVYRAVENVFVAMICLGMFYIMSRFGLLKTFLSSSRAKENPMGSVNMVTIETESNSVVSERKDANKTADDAFNVSTLSNENSDSKVGENGRDKENEKDKVEEKDETEDSARRKRKRGCRGGKKNKKKESMENIGVSTAITSSSTDDDEGAAGTTSTKALDSSEDSPSKVTNISNSLSITEHILGFGSHGTIVFKGYFESRPVAVKRMLLDFYDVASHEINLLQESDDHSNVIRYFCSQEKNKFLYIALELCSSSLEDLVEKKKDNLDAQVETSEILYQIANGVNHLHSLKIVHRDIKPQNILVAVSKNKKNGKKSVRFLISDFGLCKKLDADQSSFKGTTANAAGTSGWRAPELLLDTSPAYVDSSLANRVRLTRSVDVFSTGCVFYYVLTGGYHPFGDRYIREGNIIKGEYDLSKLNSLPDAYTIKDLISSMIHKNPMLRPDIGVIMKHPYFWSVEKKLDFLLKVSDRFEVERRDPPSELLLKLESIAPDVLGPRGWFDKFDSNFIDNLGKYRKYNTHKLMDLLRAIRNKYHHYQDLPKDLAREIGSLPDGFYWYFARRFPRMLLLVYNLMKTILHDDELLAQFF